MHSIHTSRQELILRDSNLVMGAIPAEDEIEMEGKETCAEWIYLLNSMDFDVELEKLLRV